MGESQPETKESRSEARAVGISYFWLKYGGQRYLDLQPVLKTLHRVRKQENRTMKVHYKMGPTNVTKWHEMRVAFGDVMIHDGKTTPGEKETLTTWMKRMAKQRGVRGTFRILSWPTEASKIYKEWKRVESELSTLNDFALELLWKDRRLLPILTRRKMITKIWDEFELRYDGLTRKAIEVTMPYIRNFA